MVIGGKYASHKLMASNISNILQNVGMKGATKTTQQLERHFKGVANHWRLSILLLIGKREGLTLDEITTALHANFKTISVHTQKLVQAGLINKKYVGRTVTHSLSPYGKIFHRFVKSF